VVTSGAAARAGVDSVTIAAPIDDTMNAVDSSVESAIRRDQPLHHPAIGHRPYSRSVHDSQSVRRPHPCKRSPVSVQRSQ
jgi:hypothetical protein